ncbi:MAG TPA: response regulator [Bacteroidota bacterium]|jgi:DNA-binding response OmpR family regulator|nr:response regulator [Bacteroidota bacterium]
MAERLQVLLAEDDDQLRDTLAFHLSEEGYDVTTAADGHTAIPLLHGRPFGLVILDLKMPYIDGFQVLKFIKTTFPKTKVIILTAYTDLASITKCKELGADEVVAKPYSFPHLFSVIAGVMKGEGG